MQLDLKDYPLAFYDGDLAGNFLIEMTQQKELADK